jgi:protein-S-isoprenylcysteine O-methyltransferase Ste14
MNREMNTEMTHDVSPGTSMTAIDLKTVVRFALVALLVPLLLFVAAGRVDWWQGWVYAILTTATSLISRYFMIRKNPDLVAERARFTESEGIKDWDKRIVMWVAIVGPLVFMIVAGLDKRFGWSAEVALALQLGAIGVFVLGYALATWALVANKFFSSVVRIQTERGHTVVTSGPYRFVRHPGYAGGIAAWLFSPLFIGSFWSFIPVMLVVGLTIVRTELEDRTLQNELPGYKEYAERVRYRLLPGIW